MSTLLIVDDHPAHRLVLELTLIPLGYGILTATSAQAALEFMDIVQVDLLITDLWMADMSGADLAQALRARPQRADIPILLLTGADEDDPEVRRAKALVAVSYLQKPYSPLILRKMITRLLQQTPKHCRTTSYHP